MNTFKTIKEAFAWAFDEKENFSQIKNMFHLNDEYENIYDVINAFKTYDLEKYLLENSYVIKEGNHYIYYNIA